MKKFIYSSDWHMRPIAPICRLDADTWADTQRSHLMFLVSLAKEHKCPLVVAGDIFHTACVPDWLINLIIEALKEIDVYAIAGNHDLPGHRIKDINNSSFGVLWNSGVLKSLRKHFSFAHFGDEVQGRNREVLFIHDLIFPDEESRPPVKRAKIAAEVLLEYPDAKYIFCGDQHRGFIYQQDGRTLIMAGCLNRQSADNLDYELPCWIVDLENDTFTPVDLPDDPAMITVEHIQAKNDKLDRIEALIKAIPENNEVKLNFEDNVTNRLNLFDTEESVKIKIEELMQ